MNCVPYRTPVQTVNVKVLKTVHMFIWLKHCIVGGGGCPGGGGGSSALCSPALVELFSLPGLSAFVPAGSVLQNYEQSVILLVFASLRPGPGRFPRRSQAVLFRTNSRTTHGEQDMALFRTAFNPFVLLLLSDYAGLENRHVFLPLLESLICLHGNGVEAPPPGVEVHDSPGPHRLRARLQLLSDPPLKPAGFLRPPWRHSELQRSHTEVSGSTPSVNPVDHVRFSTGRWCFHL